jgi:ASC-1-like (ASCH) protein
VNGAEPVERTIAIRRPYLDLIAEGSKTVEVRVGYPSMRRIVPGTVLGFTDGTLTVHARVTRVNEYRSFDAMLKAEDPRSINAGMTDREALAAACREIYPPAKEALGVLAIHIELVLPPPASV